ncbi:MAG: hypothetical protein FK732_11915 [Asgard group archaeon]|nr:hypothetical protein [Asgard group archaeon]
MSGRVFDRFYLFYGMLVSLGFAIWIVIGFTFNFPYWAIFALPVPLMLVVYLIWNFFRFRKKTEKELDPIKSLESEYYDMKL